MKKDNKLKLPTEFAHRLNHLTQFLKNKYPKLTFRWMDENSELGDDVEHTLIVEWESRLYSYKCMIEINENSDETIFYPWKTRKGSDEDILIKSHQLHTQVCKDIFLLFGKCWRNESYQRFKHIYVELRHMISS